MLRTPRRQLKIFITKQDNAIFGEIYLTNDSHMRNMKVMDE